MRSKLMVAGFLLLALIATPVFGKSNLIYTLVNADGLIKVPLNKGGLLAGVQVEVRLF